MDMNPTVNRRKTKAEWALHLHRLGLHVFPLVHTDKAGNCSCGDPACKPRNRGKHPKKGSRGFLDASTDIDQIKRWWREDPDANIGVWAGPTHVWIDLDTKEGSGLDTLADFLKLDAFDLTDQTFAVRTPSGGIHMYFTTDVPVGDRVGILPNVDIRGQGGYVVGPGSVIGEKVYEVITDRKIMPVPEGIQTVLRHVKERDSQAQVELFELDTKTALSRAKEFLQRRTPAVEGEGGNEHTYVTALEVRDLCVSEEKCLELMLEHWNDRCDPPWEPDEIRIPIRNAYRYAKDRPGNKGGISDKFDDSDYFPERNVVDEAEDNFARFRPYLKTINSFMEEKRTFEYICYDFIPAIGLTAFVGPRFSGKTPILVDLGMRLGSDRDWTDDHTLDRGWTVVYIVNENAEGVMESARAWCQKWNDGKPLTDESRFQVFERRLHLMDASEMEEFAHFLRSVLGNRKVAFILDTFQRSVAGAKHGQLNPDDMQTAADNLEGLARSFRGPAIVAGHTPKSGEMTWFGSGSLENSAAGLIFLTNEGNRKKIYAEKCRGRPGGEEFYVRIVGGLTGKIDKRGAPTTAPLIVYDKAGTTQKRSDDRAMDEQKRKRLQEIRNFMLSPPDGAGPRHDIVLGDVAATIASHEKRSQRAVEDEIRAVFTGLGNRHEFDDGIILSLVAPTKGGGRGNKYSLHVSQMQIDGDFGSLEDRAPAGNA